MKSHYFKIAFLPVPNENCTSVFNTGLVQAQTALHFGTSVEFCRSLVFLISALTKASTKIKTSKLLQMRVIDVLSKLVLFAPRVHNELF